MCSAPNPHGQLRPVVDDSREGMARRDCSEDCDRRDGIALTMESLTSVPALGAETSIVIVDELERTGIFLERLLRTAGYPRIHCLRHIDRVETMMRRFDPDLLVLNLPSDGVGLETIARVKILSPFDVPILVVTETGEREARHHALELGANDFLTSPFDAVEAVTRVRNLLNARWLSKAVQRFGLELDSSGSANHWLASQREVAYRLALAAEYRDNETGAHILRMSRYAAVLGQAIGLEPTERALLVHAMPMHDIGKIGIPDRILLKPGPLSEEEWTVMRQHTVIGGELLAGSPSPLLQMARAIALSHHERWDGTGYPEQLAGEAIPLVGRICAICDVFDALTSERPYKPAWTLDAALAEIRASAGSHFDPHLVDVFERELPAMLEIKRTYHDRSQWLDASRALLAH